ncbi:MAG TPA: hypothetical protein VEX68_03235 [Bryobacteraceae bacterium]|nr:hypothetical protein [Bryobacteraceae bacterium]
MIDWGWMAFTGLAGANVLAAVFGKPFIQKIAEVTAASMMRAELTRQAQDKGYGEEKGKRLATHEDIENALREVHLVTEKTETIKAQIRTVCGCWRRRSPHC